QPDAGDLPERRVRLLRRGRVHARADPALLGVALERRCLLLLLHALPALADQLVDGRHTSPCASEISASKKRGGLRPPPRPTQMARQTEKGKGRPLFCQGAAPLFGSSRWPAAAEPPADRPVAPPRGPGQAAGQSAGAGFSSAAS